jgi:hypothetical protein
VPLPPCGDESRNEETWIYLEPGIEVYEGEAFSAIVIDVEREGAFYFWLRQIACEIGTPATKLIAHIAT